MPVIELNVLTALASLIITTLSFAISLGFLSYRQHTFKGIKDWAIGAFLIAAGSVIVLFEPTFIGKSCKMIGSAISEYGLLHIVIGLKRFHNKSYERLESIAVGLLFIAYLFVVCYLLMTGHEAYNQIIVTSVATIFIALYALSILFKNSVNEIQMMYRWISGAVYALIVVMLIRIIGTSEFQSMQSYETKATFQAFMLLLANGALTVWLIGLYALAARHLEEQLSKESRIDYLTGVFNRRAIFNILEREVARAERHVVDLSIIYFDIDHFKSINDRHGHILADCVLVDMCTLINKNLRTFESLGRVGGEEFMVVLPQSDKVEATYVADKIRKLIEMNKFEYEGITMHVTVSLGVASFGDEASNIDALVTFADSRLYRAKNAGRNKVYSE